MFVLRVALLVAVVVCVVGLPQGNVRDVDDEPAEVPEPEVPKPEPEDSKVETDQSGNYFS